MKFLRKWTCGTFVSRKYASLSRAQRNYISLLSCGSHRMVYFQVNVACRRFQLLFIVRVRNVTFFNRTRWYYMKYNYLININIILFLYVIWNKFAKFLFYYKRVYIYIHIHIYTHTYMLFFTQCYTDYWYKY